MNPRLRQLLRQDLKQIINDCVDYELPGITGKTDIQKDLGFDSLDVVELLLDLEKQYQISISDEQFESVRTFQELCDLMQSILTTPELMKDLTKVGWIHAEEERPLCLSAGNWDGKQSDIVLAETFTGKKFLAQCYEGFMDGSAFYDWYQVDEINSNDWLINESVSRWMKIPF